MRKPSPFPKYRFSKEPKDRHNMSYKERMEIEVAEGRQPKDWKKRVRFSKGKA